MASKDDGDIHQCNIRVPLVPVIYQGDVILKREGLTKKVCSIFFDETSKLYELLKSALDVEKIEVTDISFYQKKYFIIEIKCKPVQRQKLVLFLDSFNFKEVLLSFGKTLVKTLRWKKTLQIQFKVLAIDTRDPQSSSSNEEKEDTKQVKQDPERYTQGPSQTKDPPMERQVNQDPERYTKGPSQTKDTPMERQVKQDPERYTQGPSQTKDPPMERQVKQEPESYTQGPSQNKDTPMEREVRQDPERYTQGPSQNKDTSMEKEVRQDPARNTPGPTQSMDTPTDRQVRQDPARNTPGPTQSMDKPTDRQVIQDPTRNTAGPTQSNDTPTERQVRQDPARNTPGPTQSMDTPTDRQVMQDPTRNTAGPTQSNDTPTERQVIQDPARNTPGPTQSMDTPTDRQVRQDPVRNTPGPTQSNDTPTERQVIQDPSRNTAGPTQSMDTQTDRQVRPDPERYTQGPTQTKDTPKEQQVRQNPERYNKGHTHSIDTPWEIQVRQDPGKYNQGLTQSRDTPMKGQVLQKLFIFYLDVKPKNVLICNLLINDMHIQLRNIQGTYLWQRRIRIEDIKQFKELCFSMEGKCKAYWDLSSYDIYLDWLVDRSSTPYIFIDLSCAKTSVEDAISEIVIDLINRVGNTDINECLFQLESLTKVLCVENDKFNQVLNLPDIQSNEKSKKVANNVKKHCSLTANNILAYCFFLTNVGDGFQIKRKEHKEFFFKKEITELLLNSCKRSNRKELPSACVNSISSILPDIFEFYYKKESSVMLYISFTLNLIDDSALLSMIESSNNEKLKQTCPFPFYSNAKDFDCVSFLVKLYEQSLVNEKYELLEKISVYLPRDIHLQFLKSVIGKGLLWLDILDTSIEHLEVKDKGQFKTFSSENDLSRVLYLWNSRVSSQLPEISEGVVKIAETAILSCLESINTFTDIPLLLTVLSDKRFFNEKCQCLKVMKHFSTSKCVEVQSHFIDLLNNEKFISLDETDTRSSLGGWFISILHYIRGTFKQGSKSGSMKVDEKRQQAMIFEVYQKFAQVMNTTYIREHESVKPIFEEAVFSFLQDCSFKALILVVQQNIEKNGDLQEIQETVSMHIRKLLTNGHVGKKPNVIMRDICGKDKLVINSSVTAKMILAIVETMDIPVDDTPLEVVMEQVIDSSTVWIEVLSASGKKISDVHNHPAVQTVRTSIQTLEEIITNQSISCKFLLFLQKKLKDVHEMFITQNKEVISSLDKCISHLTKYQKNIETTENTFKKCMKVKVCNVNEFQLLSNKLFDYTNRRKDGLHSGKITIGDLFSPTSDFIQIGKIANLCTRVEKIVSTCMFWNIFKKCLTEKQDIFPTTYETSATDHTELEGELSSSTLLSIEKVLEFITDDCEPRYKQMWSDYGTEMKQGVGSTALVFHGIQDMHFEINQAETICSLELPPANRNSLLRFSRITDYQVTVDLIKVAAKAFAFEDNPESVYTQTIDRFEAMIKGNFSDYELKDITPVLDQVHNIREIISDELHDILQGFKESSSLLDFLREVIDDDIRNLIDAVEEHSEQYVRESTVSDLIEVKRFFNPVLKENFKTNIGGLFQMLKKQAKESGIIQVRSKMFTCRENLHSLRALYRNVANRGEHTIELIDNIMQNGKFHFRLGKRKCDICVEYEPEKNGYSPTASDLGDLRSRALLIVNADKKKSLENKDDRNEKLRKFIEIIDNVFEVSNMCIKLNHAGHFEYSEYEKVCHKDDMATLKNSLQNQFKDWIAEVNKVREDFYYMNFLFSDQLFEFYTYLNKDTKNDEQITAALKYMKILPENENRHHVLSMYRMFAPPKNHRKALENIGKTLQKLHDQIPAKPQKNIGSKTQVSMLEKVQPGKPYFAWLDEGSTLVIRTLLALYLNTTQSLPDAHQVLFCREDTTYEEIDLLCKRCIQLDNESAKTQLFSIVNVEKLKIDVQINLHDRLHDLPNGIFLLCLICRGNENHPFLDQFTEHLLRLPPLSEEKTYSCLKQHCSSVTVITSDVPGAGKTECIQTKAILGNMRSMCLHISGPLHRLSIIEDLQKLHLKKYHVLHIDIGSVSDPYQLDTFLFELLVLKYVSCGPAAYALPCDQVFIEIANTVKQTLCNSLPSVAFFTREHLKWKNYDDLKVSMEVNSPIQVVCNYLKSLDEGTVDAQDIYFSGPKRLQPLSQSECKSLLKCHFNTSGDLSYTLVNIFTRVLADQLKKLSFSIYFRTESLSAMLGNKCIPSVKSSLVNALINIAKEFSSRSVNTCRSTQALTILGEDEKDKDVAQIMTERLAGMIRWKDSNHLVILFHQNMQTVSPFYRSLEQLPQQIVTLFERQMKRKLDNFREKTTEELEHLLIMLTRQSGSFLPTYRDMLNNLRIDYALTPDNLLKMVLISLRVNANIPVLIMGETGCGKTSLIRYLAKICDVTFDVFSIHAGINSNQIRERLNTANSNARQCLKVPYWFFWDEVNTCDHLGLITSIVCHRFYQGIQLSPNLTLLAACNPYRLRREESILTAGLQGKIKTDDRSKLVYRVHPLPESLVDFVWDYGSLSDEDEDTYIRKMVGTVEFGEKLTCLLVKVLVLSQRFVRHKEKNEYCVSLRDVDRCRKLIKWINTFLKRKNDIDTRVKKKQITLSEEDRKLKSIILGLTICYQCRFTDGSIRYEYRVKLAECINSMEYTNISAKYIGDIILNEQFDIVSRMAYLPEGTALNAALQENVFMLLVCILCKVPIFLVGKPGCSKSLSIQLIRSNLRGKDSNDPLFQDMPQLFCVSFQGSESSTSDGIMKVFEKAQKYQKHNDEKDVLSVVILDEIGLAEISRFNPLKVLHGLLEPDDGTTLNIAVVGISNWALDAAKMNRAIHLSRPDMDLDELKITGKFIGESMINTKNDVGLNIPTITPQSEKVELDIPASSMLDGIATAYNDYCSKVQKFPNFHGLRDFYSLTKYVARNMGILFSAGEKEMSDIISTGIVRNFGGLPTEQNALIGTFKKYLPQVSSTSIPVIKLIRENILDKTSRHLMLITNGDVVISVLERELYDMGISFDIIFGSSFEEDLSDDYNYRILSRIILCMEQGIVLILKDLEAIYGSLYDMLNQNYTVIGNKKNCRVALGQYSNPMCHVHDDFKCIVLVEESRLDYSDPPFLNRFEKQHFEFKELIETETTVVHIIKEEMKEFCQLQNQTFIPDDIIPTYSEDLLVSLVVRSKQILGNESSSSDVKSFIYDRLLWLLPPEIIVRGKDSVLFQKKAALVGELIESFMKLPIHGGISNLFEQLQFCANQNEVSNNAFADNNVHCFFVYTFSCLHSIIEDTFGKCKVQKYKMAIFKSEKQFSTTIEDFFQTLDNVLIIQCIASTEIQYILLSKVIIEKAIRQLREKNALFKDTIKCIYMVIHLDRKGGQQLPINFLSDWKLLYLDTIHTPFTSLDHFISVNTHEIVQERRPLTSYIMDSLFWVFSRIKFTSGYRSSTSLTLVNNLECILKSLRTCACAIDTLEKLLVLWIEDQTPPGKTSQWCVDVAKNTHELLKSGTLIGALENTVQDFIRKPLAIFLFQMIEMNLLSPVFVEDAYTIPRRKTWQKYVLSKKHLDISGIPKPSGPECYSCSSEYLHLKMPYSQSFAKSIDQKKMDFMEIIKRLQSESYEDPEEEVSLELFNDTIKTCGKVVNFDAVDIDLFSYPGRIDDYIHDFCNMYSLPMSTFQKRVPLFLWALSQFVNLPDLRNKDFQTIFTTLHASVWVYGLVIEAVFQMAELPTVPLELLCQDLNDSDIVGPLDKMDETSDGKPTGSIKTLRITELDRKSFVKEICLSLLPTQTVLMHYSSMDNWLSIVRRMLPLARIVDKDSSDILSLRLCQEIAEAFNHSDLKNMEYIFPVASSLQQAEGNFDSPEVCRGIYQTLLELQSTGSVDISNLQGLFCSYICRCLSESPENVFPFEFALQKICNNEIFEQSLNYFGQVFKYAFTIDMIDNEDVFIDILSEVKDSKETTFCICLNGWLEKLDLSNTCNTFLPVLLTDVLEQIAFNEELDITNVKGIIKSTHPILRHLVSAVAISKQGVCSIHTLLSIAYIRKFLKLFVQILESVKFDCSEIIVLSQNVNAVLCQDESMGFSTLVSTEILHLFLKMLNSSSALGDIKIILEKIRNTITVMHNISNIWSDSTDEWPVFFPFYNHKNLDIYQPLLQEIINIGPTENKFKVVLESSDKSPLALLSILSRRFYMKLCLQERNYNEKRAAEELHLQIKESTIHMNIKNIAMRLLGIKEFKHNIFNLSEMVDEPIPQIVSVMIHLTGIITVSNASKNIWYRAMFSPKDVSADFTKLPQIFKLILNILLYSCYTASFALEFVSEKMMTTILPESKESVENILEQELKQNWINLQAMLKMNFNDMCVMLHELVYRSFYLFTSEAEIFTSEQFSEQLINQHIEVSKDIVTTRIEVIQTVKSGIPFNAETTIEKCVYDIEACKYDLDFQSAVLLFRLTSSPSKDVFLAEVQARHGEEFRFLSNVVDNMEKLELPQFILSFIKWHSAVVSCAKYKFRKVDFKDLTVLNFLQAFSEDGIRKNRLEEAFKHFSNDCNKLFTKFKKLLKEKGIDEEVITTMMHTKVKMPVCTILEEQSVMFKILKVLVSEQNRFINAAYSLSDQQNIIIREISVQDVRKSHLIKFEWDDYWLDYSQCDTRYGLGRKINFYFGNIERVLKQSLLVGKTLINIPSPLDKIIFTDDLFQNSIELMTEISNSIPQSRLSIEMKNSLQHKKERDVSQITELLNHTGMTLSLLRKTKTGIDPSRSLINYLKEWQHVTGMTSAAIKKLFPEDIRVGQVVDLYKWLEDINGENILETLEDRYRVVLVDSAKNSLLDTKENKMQYLEQLEHPLKVFIHRFLGVKDNDISLKQPLLEYISNKDLWWSDDFKDEQVFVKELPLSLHILLPPMILTENIHEVVEFVLNAAQESKQKESSKTLKSLNKTEPAKEAPVQSKKAMAKKMMKF